MYWLRHARTTVPALALLWVFGAVAAPEVKNVRMGIHPGKTRLVIDLSEAVAYRIFNLADPYRIVIDLPEVLFDASIRPRSDDVGVISGMRFGLYRPGQSRIVLDLGKPALVTKSFSLPAAKNIGPRLVLDLTETGRGAFLAALARLKPLTRPKERLQAPPLPLKAKPKRADGKKVVVIDPGHGGVDPGAIAVDGNYEKNITLSFSRQLRDHLKRSGRYHVVLTRERDIFVKLRERIAAARGAGGDLFLSIHADSLANTKVRGSGVYTLSERSSDKEAAALAAKENKSDIIAGVDLDGHDDEVASILIDLMQRETMNFSANFATAVVSELQKAGRMRSRPHRFGGFLVLKAPDVPSVLVEIGYLSNNREAAMLQSAKGRSGIIDALTRAVDAYFAKTLRVTTN